MRFTEDIDHWQCPGLELHQRFDQLRQDGPVVPINFMGADAWLLTSHEAVLSGFRDNENFPPATPYKLGIEPMIGETFQTMEGERHRFYRKLATPSFRPRQIEQMDSSVLSDIAEELITGFASDDQADLVSQFTELYPYAVIAELLGIPRAEQHQFNQWVNGLLNFRWQPVEAEQARDALWAYLDPIIEQRKVEPGDDVISQLIHDELDGVRMTDAQVKAHIGIMFTAGSSTTHDSLGNLLYALLVEPERWQRLQHEPDMRAAAIEEALRWESAVSVLPRMSREDRAIEFFGQTLAPNSIVFFGITGANHDPAVFDDPHSYDMDRDTEGLMSFGPGPRMCPGMHLARKELAITLDILLERLPNLTLLNPDTAKPTGTVFRNPDSLLCRY